MKRDMKSSRCALTILLLCCLYLPLIAHASGGDNRYCDPGNVAHFGNTDGPAALPQSCFYTALSATPVNNRTIRVSSGSDLQAAIDKAKCGDTLELEAGSTFHGRFNFPTKGCDDRHWILVRSNGQIPPEGTRI